MSEKPTEPWPSDAACRAANEAYHGGHHGYLGAMHCALRAAYSVDFPSAAKPNPEAKGRSTRVIHKARLDVVSVVQTIQMPSGACVRAVQNQGGHPTIWYECEPDAPLEPRHFVIVGTGWPLPDVGAVLYLGTVQIGEFVWHVYEAGP